MLPAELSTAIDAWLAEDLDEATRSELARLRADAGAGDEAALAELADAFAGPLEFGTAGLRGKLGPGPGRMNRVVVSQAAAGLAAYLLAQGLSGGKVIVGFDARHNSGVFARDTAQILAAAGFEALLTPGPTPTPVVAFGIRHFGCVAGVVVTASHNPPQDNGYKVYLGDGSQIVPPADAEIAAQIRAVAARPLADVPRSDHYTVLKRELQEAYVDRVAGLVPAGAPREITWVYTALHGVGTPVVTAVVERAGFPRGAGVTSQIDPDPDFPTVSFPNPEEPGAMDAALALAVERGVDVVIANDPDADRCAVAVPDAGGWRMLTGDELGCLLADDLLARGVQGVYACSIVSSTQLATMARAAGQPHAVTLTGFKWIGRVPDLAFGYEEAIGYCCDPAAVPDKDGISALVTVLALAAKLKSTGSSLPERLAAIARKHGLYQTGAMAFRVDDLALIAEAMARLRANPPATLAGEPVAYTDLSEPGGAVPPTDGCLFEGELVRAVVRPSGTEPKLKCYLQVRASAADSQDVPAAKAAAIGRLEAVRADLRSALGL